VFEKWVCSGAVMVRCAGRAERRAGTSEICPGIVEVSYVDETMRCL
jgi:hypothetical protein